METMPLQSSPEAPPGFSAAEGGERNRPCPPGPPQRFSCPALRRPGVSSLPTQAAPLAGTHLYAASVGLETACGVLGGDAALDGAAVDADVLLPQAQVRQAAALGHVDLGMHQVHALGRGGVVFMFTSCSPPTPQFLSIVP